MPRLKITLGGETTQRELVKPVLVAGRLPDLDLALPVREASRRHFQIGRFKDGSWGVKDLGSTNGTWVNGEKITLVKLKHGDEIRVGPDCTISFLDPPPPPAKKKKRTGPIVLKSRADKLREQQEAERKRRRQERRKKEREAAAAAAAQVAAERTQEVEPEEPAEEPVEVLEIESEEQLDGLMRDRDAFDRLVMEGKRKVRFGAYTLKQRLSAGGMGVVFKARHHRKSMDVALKVLRTDVVDESNIARFQQEAWAISAFDHPNIVKVRDLSRHAGMHYIAMDFIDGGDLLAKGFKRELTFWQIAEVVHKLADVLKLVHARNIWHRDIKPQNVLMDRHGEVKLIDFGIATVEREQTDATKTAEGLIMGTPAFLSPEQAARGRMGAIDGRADLYSLGAVMYYLLTGRRPFTGKSPLEILKKNMTEMPVPPQQVEELAPEGLCAICWKLMKKRPEDRYQSADELQAAIEKWRKTPDGRHELERHKKIMKLRARKARHRG